MAPTIRSEVGIGQPPKEIRPPANSGAMGDFMTAWWLNVHVSLQDLLSLPKRKIHSFWQKFFQLSLISQWPETEPSHTASRRIAWLMSFFVLLDASKGLLVSWSGCLHLPECDIGRWKGCGHAGARCFFSLGNLTFLPSMIAPFRWCCRLISLYGRSCNLLLQEGGAFWN